MTLISELQKRYIKYIYDAYAAYEVMTQDGYPLISDNITLPLARHFSNPPAEIVTSNYTTTYPNLYGLNSTTAVIICPEPRDQFRAILADQLREESAARFCSNAIALLGIVLNCLCISIILFLLKTGCIGTQGRYYLTLNVAASDLISAIFATWFLVFSRWQDQLAGMHSNRIEVLISICYFLAYKSPGISYATLSIFQYIAVRKPLFYATQVTQRTFAKAIAFNWLIIVGTSSLYGMVTYILTVKPRRTDAERRACPLTWLKQTILPDTLLTLFILCTLIPYVSILYTTVRKRLQGSARRISPIVRMLGLHVCVYTVSATILLLSDVNRPFDFRKRNAEVRLRYVKSCQMDLDDEIYRDFLINTNLQRAGVWACVIWQTRLILEASFHLFADPLVHNLIRAIVLIRPMRELILSSTSQPATPVVKQAPLSFAGFLPLPPGGGKSSKIAPDMSVAEALPAVADVKHSAQTQ